MGFFARAASTAAVVLGVVVLCSSSSEAHKPITSRFTYNADVFPIFLHQCGHCHIAGGVGPMSLVTYGDAFPWAESLRAELLDAGRRPEFIEAAHRNLSARELDIVLDWAAGGTPQGDPANAPSPVTLRNEWAAGTPDLTVQPVAPFEVPTNLMELTQEFAVQTSLDRPREISAFDLLPGAPAVVRDATILVRVPNAPAQTLGTWVPKQVPAVIGLKPGTILPAGAELVMRIHYKKTWKYEGQAITDRSTLGIYF